MPNLHARSLIFGNFGTLLGGLGVYVFFNLLGAGPSSRGTPSVGVGSTISVRDGWETARPKEP